MFVFTYCLAAKHNGHVVEFLNSACHARLVIDGKPEDFYNGYTLKGGKEVVLEADVGGTRYRAVMKGGVVYKAELYGGQDLLAEGKILS